MKTKLITATAFSLLMAVGAASAQSSAPSGDPNNTPGQNPAVSTTNPSTPGATDPMMTNSTNSSGDRTQQNCVTGEQSATNAPVTAEGQTAENKCAE